MKRFVTAALLTLVAACAAAAQDADGFRPIVNPPKRPVPETLRAAGNFKIFLSLLEQAGFRDLGLMGPGVGVKANPAVAGRAGAAGVGDPQSTRGATQGQRAPGGGEDYHTIFAPNDAAFAKLPPGALDALRKDPARLRAFILAHIVPGKVMMQDIHTPAAGAARKELKTKQGRVIGFHGDPHAGAHIPSINGGAARFGRLQNAVASDAPIVLHEIDAVLAVDIF